ncbi:MAG: FecR domain-containing protein, partial [Alphaproteobacteria bacterium]|nr:FecR domain-containing protein [Alphaproteobacteria bacterium]
MGKGLGGLALAVLVLAAGAGAARDIGITSAVVPAARGTPPQQAPRVLRIGEDILANERLQTDAGGRAHLLFVDGSALSVGENSDLTLDRFIYDPNSKTGELAFSASRGVFRLVGGKISKTNDIVLRTPTATIGIRGGIAVATVTQETTSADFLFGTRMTVIGTDNQRQVAERPGSRISIEIGKPPSDPAPVPPAALQQNIASLEAAPTAPPKPAAGPTAPPKPAAGPAASPTAEAAPSRAEAAGPAASPTAEAAPTRAEAADPAASPTAEAAP